VDQVGYWQIYCHPYASDLMWVREPFLSSDRDWSLRVVHGHVIVEDVAFRPNRIGIDSGAYKSRVLTCLVVEPDAIRMLQTPGRDGRSPAVSDGARSPYG
jgi:diadenosine tetraphosphatase ApaH/serine/threonine PP2A family protein phosphatase